jgi:hypothetical protein
MTPTEQAEFMAATAEAGETMEHFLARAAAPYVSAAYSFEYHLP